MKNIVTIIGTRPEAIKMAPVVRALKSYPNNFNCIVCVTGQHREMLMPILDLFAIKVDYNLDIMEANQNLSSLTGKLFTEISKVLDLAQADWVLAQGDTTSVMVASMVAFYKKIRFGHIEAGLRTDDRLNPFPEEVNRRIADLVADVHFTPTEKASKALIREGYRPDKIILSGNTVIDAVTEIAGLPFEWENSVLANIPEASRVVLITAHRRESFGEPMRNLFEAIRDLAIKYQSKEISFVFPVHLNPQVRSVVYSMLDGIDNIYLTPPLDYSAIVHLMKRAVLILTDSGGIQEEAPTFAVPVLVMRDKTERPEGVEAGLTRLVGTNGKLLIEEASSVLDNGSFIPVEKRGFNPYGDGRAAQRIVEYLINDTDTCTIS